MSPRAGSILLLEIGTEEIPARMIDGALRELRLALIREFEAGRLVPETGYDSDANIRTFGTPRRLAVLAHGLRERQPDSVQEVCGPLVQTAFDPTGRPTGAAEGFARSQGIAVKDLKRITTPKGECVGVSKSVRGSTAAEVLGARLPQAVLSIAFPKTMRWGAGDYRFVRPIHWIVALLDEAILDLTIAGVHSGNRTRGHRCLGNAWITIRNPTTYHDTLRDHGVEVDIEIRGREIGDTLLRIVRDHGAVLASPPGAIAGTAGDPDLLREVTHSVEWPHVIVGEFDAAFLELPREILVTAMRHHQKSFSMSEGSARLLNRFLAVADAPGDPEGAIRKGNEWVLRARLADALFFWEEDRKSSLEEHATKLARVTLQEKLGSYARKCERMVALAGPVREGFELSGARVERDAVEDAVRLCKADLTTQMVKEFPELEGIVGGLYARADRRPESVARAIYAHHLPRGADDPLPSTPEGAIVGLVDRLDTQAGIFLLGIVPTGSRDPYGLRRSVLGSCRILIDNKVRLSLGDVIDRALAGYGKDTIDGSVPVPRAKTALLEFYRGRLQFMGEEAGLRQDSVRAALAASADDPYDARLRMEALEAFREDAGFPALVLAHKRIKNILKDRPTTRYEAAGFKEDAERDLERALRVSTPAIESAEARSDPLQALREMARLGPTLDRFFSEVLVLAEDPRLRDNRLGLLHSIARLFLRVGDFSDIVVAAQTAGTPQSPDAARRRPGEARR